MTRLLTDGAESGDLTRLASAMGHAISGTHGPFGSYSYRLLGNVTSRSYFIKPPTLASGLSEAYFRWRANADLWFGNSYPYHLLSWYSGITLIGSLALVDDTPLLGVYDASTQRATAVASLFCNEWVVIEVHVLIGASGTLQCRVNGTQIINFSGTTNTAGATFDNFQLANLGAGRTLYLDDIALNDAAGGADNSWCGGGGVLAALLPTGAGNYGQFAIGGTTPPASAYQAVDDLPHTSDADFIYDATVDHKHTFALSNPTIPTGYGIPRVILDVVAKGASGDKLALLLRSNGSDSQDSDQNLAVGPYGHLLHEWLVNPDGGGAWTAAAVNALEAGVVAR